MGNSNYVDVNVTIKGQTQTIKMEKGCTFETKAKRYHVENDGKLSIFNKNTGKTTSSNDITMTNYQFSTFKAMANNTKEDTGNDWTLSIADIKEGINKFRKGQFRNDIAEFLKGYAPQNSKLYSKDNKITTYITNGNAKTSSTITFQFDKPEANQTQKTQNVTTQNNPTNNGNFANNENVITTPAQTHVLKSGENLVSLAKKYEIDTYEIVAANPQLKEGRDYTVNYTKNGTTIDTKIKAGTKITIPQKYQVKPGSVKNLDDVAKVTGMSKDYLKDVLTIIEVNPKHPGKPDLEGYKDGIGPNGGAITIGFGHVGKVDGKPIQVGQKITEEKAHEILANDILKHEAMTVTYMGKENWDKTPESVKSAIFDITYNKGIWDGFKNPNYNQNTKKIKSDLEKGHYASALCDTYRLSGCTPLLERNVYRFIAGLSDLPENKRQAAIKAYEPQFKTAYNKVNSKKATQLNAKYMKTAWENAKNGKTTGFRMKANQ